MCKGPYQAGAMILSWFLLLDQIAEAFFQYVQDVVFADLMVKPSSDLQVRSLAATFKAVIAFKLDFISQTLLVDVSLNDS